MNSNLKSFDEYKEYFEKHMYDVFPEKDEYSEVLFESMQYSLNAGGKRLRPVLLLASCDLVGGNIEEALPYASAIEYVHTYSLIHDDLPAMDNDELRRGKPTNHMVYGAGMATLAGDGLLNTAFEVMTDDILEAMKSGKDVSGRISAMHEIALGAGVRGMIAGQTADIKADSGEGDADLLRYIQLNKTAALIKAAVRAGLYLGNADEDVIKTMTEYAEDLGIAFQVDDDILDVLSTTEELGKPVGSDEGNDKLTYVSLNGLERSREELVELTDEAIAAAEKCDDSEFFSGLAAELETRKK